MLDHTNGASSFRVPISLGVRLCSSQLDDEHCVMQEVILACNIEALAMLSQVNRRHHRLCRPELRSLHDEYDKIYRHCLEYAFGSNLREERNGRVTHHFHYNIHAYECIAQRDRELISRTPLLAVLGAFMSDSSISSIRSLLKVG